MAKDGPRFLRQAAVLLATLTFVGLAGICRAGEPDGDAGIGTTLAVQTALLQGTDHVKRFEYKEAVQILESQLPRINGNRQYLTALRDAYRGYIDELRREKKDDEAKLYTRRLAILDGKPQGKSTVAKDAETKASAIPVKNEVKAVASPQAKKNSSDSLPASPEPVFRANIDDPFQPENNKGYLAKNILEDADAAFDKRQFPEAGKLYQRAYQADRAILAGKEDRLAYCQLDHVVRQLNSPPAGGLALVALEQEVEQAVQLAPKLQPYGKSLLARIRERRGGDSGNLQETEVAPVKVNHREGPNGWEVAETANFRIMHKGQSRELVEKAAAVAERTRTTMGRKWLGDAEEQWKPACEVFLHATVDDYVRETGKQANSPGHSTVSTEKDRVISRRIDLHCDEPAMLARRLPHETTHVVLAGKFGDKPLPRWADEGLAVMAEPRCEIDRYLGKLQECRCNHQLFYFNKMIEMQDYPEARRIDAFYCESVSLVEFLLKEKDAATLAKFLRDGTRLGYEAAAKRCYGFADLNDMQKRWEMFAFGQTYTKSNVADRGR